MLPKEWIDCETRDIAGLAGDHSALRKMIGQLDEAIKRGKKPLVKRLLRELRAAERLHFQREENIMRQSDYPDFRRHKNQHDLILSDLDVVIHLISTEGLASVGDRFVEHIESMFTEDIAMDEALKSHLQHGTEV